MATNLAYMPTTWTALRGYVGDRADFRIGNNTTATRWSNYYGVNLHGSEIVRVYEDGSVGVRHCGWVSVTTFDRIRRFLPSGFTAGFSKGEGHVTNYNTGERFPIGSREFLVVKGD